jgi:hypothetical protein
MIAGDEHWVEILESICVCLIAHYGVLCFTIHQSVDGRILCLYYILRCCTVTGSL